MIRPSISSTRRRSVSLYVGLSSPWRRPFGSGGRKSTPSIGRRRVEGRGSGPIANSPNLGTDHAVECCCRDRQLRQARPKGDASAVRVRNETGGGRMALRNFSDASGREWQVYDVTPPEDERRRYDRRGTPDSIEADRRSSDDRRITVGRVSR